MQSCNGGGLAATPPPPSFSSSQVVAGFFDAPYSKVIQGRKTVAGQNVKS